MKIWLFIFRFCKSYVRCDNFITGWVFYKRRIVYKWEGEYRFDTCRSLFAVSEFSSTEKELNRVTSMGNKASEVLLSSFTILVFAVFFVKKYLRYL